MDDERKYRDTFGPIYGSTFDTATVEPGISWLRIWARVVVHLFGWILFAALVVPVAYVIVKGEADPASLLVAALPLSVYGAFVSFGRGHKGLGWFARLTAIGGFLVVAFFALIGLAMYGAAQP